MNTRSKTDVTLRYGFLAVVFALVFAVTFSGVSIYSAWKLNDNLGALDTHPFQVSMHLQEMRRQLSGMEVYVGRLTDDNTRHNRELVKQVIVSGKKEIDELLGYIRKNYLGPSRDIDRIESELAKLYVEQDKIVSLATERAEGLGKLIYGDFASRYARVDREILKTIEQSSLNGKKIADNSVHLVNFNIVVSVALSALMVILVFLFQRTAYRRMRERRFHDDTLRIIAENVGYVFILYNMRSGEVEYVSPNALQVLGIGQDELKKDPLQLINGCVSPDSDAIANWFRRRELPKEAVSYEVQFLNPVTGEQRWMSLGVNPVREDTVPARCIFTVSDLSDTKQAQQVLKDALLNAQNANNAKSSFLSRMSHEIRTPMNAIIGMTTIAAMVIEDKKRLENCLSKIALSSRHLLMLINDVLDMSKIESGKMTVMHEPFEFDDLMKNVSSMIYPQAAAKKLHFEMVTNVVHESLVGDVLRVNQILINILSNALKFTPENGHVRLSVEEITKRHDQRIWLRFTVADTGRGMSRAFLDKLFLPFEQENSHSGKLVEGTGLGMPITKNLVTLMNGTIQVESELGKGSVFTVEIGFEATDTGADKWSGVLEKLNILVVDDDPDTCVHTQIILDRMGMQAEWVLSGEEAVSKVMHAYAQHNSYDVVFIDWKMPGMDGIETTQKIRQKIGPDALIVIISAYDWSEIEQEARLAGANAFISKPMLQSTIYQTLVSVTRKFHKIESVSSTAHDLSGKHILVAEDNALNQEIMEALLKTAGATVDIAGDGLAVVNKFAASSVGTYDLILMDIQMPYQDGYEATRTIRRLSRPDALGIPIVAMTANVFADDVVKAKKAGMNGHLGKPVDIKSLYQMISEQLEKTEHET